MFPWEKKEENGWSFPEHHVRQPETYLHVRAQTELEGHTTASCQKDTGMQGCPGTQEMRNDTGVPPISQYFQRCLIINALSIMPLQHRDTFNCILSVLLCLTSEVKPPAQRLPSLENSPGMCLK